MTSGYETLASEHHYQGRSQVRIDTVRTPQGDEVVREIVEHDDAVAMVPVTADGEVLLVRQYRHAVGAYVLEIPAGTLDIAGEAPLDAARRELHEEIAHDASELRELTVLLNSAGWTTERTTLYEATGLRPIPPPDGFVAEAEEAEMEIVSLPLPDVVDAVRTGEIGDAKTVAGVLLVAARRGLLA